MNGKHTPEENGVEEEDEDKKDDILSSVTEKLESLKVSHDVSTKNWSFSENCRQTLCCRTLYSKFVKALKLNN